VSAHPTPVILSDLDRRPAGEREALLRHVAECAHCRASYLEERPERAFSLLAARPIPPDLLDRVTDAVLGEVDAEAARPAPVSLSWRSLAAAGWAAALIVAGGLFLLSRGFGEEQPFGARSSLPLDEALAPAASVALLESPGEARVMDLTVGGTQLVMIFDEEMDL
jgi:hypothetical protein